MHPTCTFLFSAHESLVGYPQSQSRVLIPWVIQAGSWSLDGWQQPWDRPFLWRSPAQPTKLRPEQNGESQLNPPLVPVCTPGHSGDSKLLLPKAARPSMLHPYLQPYSPSQTQVPNQTRPPSPRPQTPHLYPWPSGPTIKLVGSDLGSMVPC